MLFSVVSVCSVVNLFFSAGEEVDRLCYRIAKKGANLLLTVDCRL